MNNWFPTRSAIKVKSGIRAQSKSGAFANKWWGKRWIKVLEGFNISARLQRGRTYARQGQVTELHIDKGLVRAKVQGSRKTPYTVTIKFKTFGVREWAQLLDCLMAKPVFAAQLLNNEMPESIEGVFTDAGLSLFPNASGDLETNCTCPDWSNPCKHTAAVYYLMAEALDNDPFLLLKLRGMAREQFVEELSALTPHAQEDPVSEKIPLPLDALSFWQGTASTSDPHDSEPIESPAIHAALPKRLGPLKFWRGEIPFIKRMEGIYEQVHKIHFSSLKNE
jgi:uncharacterized Zn finger protein